MAVSDISSIVTHACSAVEYLVVFLILCSSTPSVSGTTRRIENWDQLSEREKEVTWRRISKRNEERRKILLQQQQEQQQRQAEENAEKSGEEL